MELTENLKKKFNKNGFVIIENVITTKHVQKLKQKVIELADYEKKQKQQYIYKFDASGKTQRVWNLVDKSKIFSDLLEINLINEFMNFIFDRPTKHQKYHLSSFQANIISPGSDRQKLHVDTPCPEPLPAWPIKANTIWFLDDFTNENGATEFISGTHQRKFKPKEDDDVNCEVTKAIGPAGSVLITHGALWHRAGANKSQKDRIGLLCSFAASYALEIAFEENQSKIISDETLNNLSDEVKKIIGFGHGIKDGALIKHPD